ALGGVYGRGFFLFEDSSISYTIPVQAPGSKPNDRDWTVSLFLDSRPVAGEQAGDLRRLVTFEGGGFVNLLDHASLEVCPVTQLGSSCTTLLLPRGILGTYTHLAFRMDRATPGTSETDDLFIFQDGFLFAKIPIPAGFEIFDAAQEAELTIGAAAGEDGVRGWLDELRVFEGSLNYEVMCNHAAGTLLAVPPSYVCLPSQDGECVSGTELDTILTPFPTYTLYSSSPGVVDGRQAVHEALYGPQAQVNADSDQYLCHVSYAIPQTAPAPDEPPGINVYDSGDPNALSIREQLLFPEGELAFGHIRPDSTLNGFCLSCHHDNGKGGLTVTKALSLPDDCSSPYDGCLLEVDPRRQPSQAPQLLLGHIPADYFGTGKPSTSLDDAGADGHRIDEWVHDPPLYHWSFDEGAGGTVANKALGNLPEPSTNGTLSMGPAFASDANWRSHFLEFDAGLDGPNDDIDRVEIDHAFELEGSAVSVSAWFRLGGVQGVSDPAARQCLTNCTLIAKAKNGEDWYLRIRNLGTEASPFWSLGFGLQIDNLPVAVWANLPGFDDAPWHHVA
ncbi:MAG: hypothetical protein AAFY88_19985, partial [Acidobacteriota bacterium]